MNKGKHTAIVTGGSSGIGFAIVEALLDQGARVIVADIQKPDLTTGKNPDWENVAWVSHDISTEASWNSLLEGCGRQGFVPDLLVNCAGIMVPTDTDATTPELFDKTMAVNAGGTLLGCRSFIAALAGAGHAGAIVNVASTTAIKPAPWVTAYSASKAAVVSLTKSVALHCAQHGYPIRCNAVLPGVVHTPMVEALVSASPDRVAAIDGLVAHHPIGRLVKPEEVAAAVLFLGSDAASGITGASLVVDGGMTAG